MDLACADGKHAYAVSENYQGETEQSSMCLKSDLSVAMGNQGTPNAANVSIVAMVDNYIQG
jgi:hypothetical protein